MKQLLFFLAVWILFTLPVSAQSAKFPVDSLQTLLKASKADTNRVNLFLELGHGYIFKPGELASDLDTALLLSRQAYQLSHSLGYRRGEGMSYLTTAQAYREKGDKQLGRQFTQRAMDLLTRYGSAEDKADAYVEMATYVTITGEELNEKIRLYVLTVPLFEQARDTSKLADALKYRGDLYQLRDDNVQSMADLRRSLSLYHSLGHSNLQDLYSLMGHVSTRTGDLEGGIKYGLMAQRIAEQLQDSSQLVAIYNRLGFTYDGLNQYQKAVDSYRKSLFIAERRGDSRTVISIASNVCHELVKTNQGEKALLFFQSIIKRYPPAPDDIERRMLVAGRFVALYNHLHQYAQAQQYGDELEKLVNPGLGKNFQLFKNRFLIPFLIDSKQYDKARVLLAEQEKLCESAHFIKDLSLTHLWWFKLDSTQSNYPSAIRHFQRSKALSDSLVNEAKNQRIAQLDVQYQTQEKEHNIALLTEQSRSQQNTIRQDQTTRNFIVGGAVMLALLLGMVYNRYRLKQRSNQLLEAKQIEINQKNQSLQQVLREKDSLLEQKDGLLTEKEWLLKEIHHRVKNNLQIITSLLHSQSVYLKDEAAQSAIRESQNRVHAMALIHQKLYQSDRLASIPIADYIEEIVGYLIDSFDRQGTIKKQFAIAPIDLDVTLAVPLGLIINEVVTNSLKYAFPAHQQGSITVELTVLDSQNYWLVIGDDGIGLPADFNPKMSRTLGMSLIRGLSKQIGGELRINQGEGLQISLVFSEEKIPQPELVGG